MKGTCLYYFNQKFESFRNFPDIIHWLIDIQKNKDRSGHFLKSRWLKFFLCLFKVRMLLLNLVQLFSEVFVASDLCPQHLKHHTVSTATNSHFVHTYFSYRSQSCRHIEQYKHSLKDLLLTQASYLSRVKNTNLIVGYTVTFIEAESHLCGKVFDSRHVWCIKFEFIFSVTVVIFLGEK